MTGNPETDRSPFDDLPGDLMIWVLIISELLVFGAGLAAFLGVRITDPEGFAAAQDHLHRAVAGINTVILVTSGWLAALGAAEMEAGRIGRGRGFLTAAATLGLVFLAVKWAEYADKAAQGIGVETHPFFTFYYLITGFHAAHVAAGIVVLLLTALRARPSEVEAGVAFWHMVDLVWVLVFPVIYLLR
ncbi:MAG: cytochrome c oxidase subunit 3 [Rhodobacteraceae bacterium]|nr:cytochrome c oxidase subunit 3 [Paracoccaceae bacterium]